YKEAAISYSEMGYGLDNFEGIPAWRYMNLTITDRYSGICAETLVGYQLFISNFCMEFGVGINFRNMKPVGEIGTADYTFNDRAVLGIGPSSPIGRFKIGYRF